MGCPSQPKGELDLESFEHVKGLIWSTMVDLVNLVKPWVDFGSKGSNEYFEINGGCTMH
ncbi:hypothetical protein IEQ34_010835 [Dendrobium chrysotoxum]|uniref:Uncharacterized protein n=1 Tax=Dendrobium chrysotoxum TaxID=161865 RepID=A0AAV7GX76_DENCH|nr:hypothetical protein IEQ34_010835 [Dendrobium chrysotoxum]